MSSYGRKAGEAVCTSAKEVAGSQGKENNLLEHDVPFVFFSTIIIHDGGGGTLG